MQHQRAATALEGRAAKRVLATRIGVAAGALLLTTALVLTVAAGAWGSTLRDEARLLPGTLIAGVDVGGMTEDEARALATDALAGALDAPVVLAHLDEAWTTTPRELGASTDLEERIAAASVATQEASLAQLVRLRWAAAHERPLEVGISIPDEAIAAHVQRVADQLELAPIDARLRWVDGAPVTTDDVEGLAVDREATIDALAGALRGAAAADDGPIGVVTDHVAAEVSTAAVAAGRDAALRAIDAALDHAVTVAHGELTWSVTPRELGASPRGEPLVEAAMDASRRAGLTAELDLPGGAVDALVTDLAGTLDLAPVHASVSYRGGSLEHAAGRDGRSLDRDRARDELVAAVRDRTATVALELDTVRARTDVDDVLLVRQSARVVELHRGGQLVRSWPVAVGTGGSPTPTGTFTVGAKRFEPTWVNPALDRWGKDMPARIGPGPDNPLGLRALNWNRAGGGDTLIRFHGTPNEASIGTAASNGCVRMFNADVIELYDLVPSGTTIVSIA